VGWAEAQPGVVALALVGSYARGVAGPDSDVDLMILCEQPERYVQETGWVRCFGPVERWAVEDWGNVSSVRVWYSGGPEVEFGLAAPDWAAQPLDEGTRRVLADGFLVLHDPRGLLAVDR
jgi:predicted nucleotidyltransferase